MRTGRPQNTPEIIWDRYIVNPSGCWEWTGCLKKGRGRVTIGKREYKVSRLAYELVNGPIPKGFLICHHCDNPKCFNPEHLFLGTYQENSDDMVRKGRAARLIGEKNGASRLTEVQVLEIFLALGTQREIAARFHVSQSRVSMIKSQRQWKHIHGKNK